MIRIFGFVYGRLTETQSLGRHVASRGHILVANQPVYSLMPLRCVLGAGATYFFVFSLTCSLTINRTRDILRVKKWKKNHYANVYRRR